MLSLKLDRGRVALTEAPRPAPPAGEALVRVRMAGICNTDLELARGYMGFEGTLGHEFVGEIEACADPSRVGSRVVGEINAACGRCPACAAGLGRHCGARSVLGILGRDGCFAEYLSLPLANLHPVPAPLSDERACFAEPVAAAYEILEQRPDVAGARVAVLGDGKLGLLIAQVLQAEGADTSLLGRHAHKLAIAAARGVQTPDPGAVPDKSFDVVVEATGSAAGMERAIALVRPRGTIVLKSTYEGKLELDAAPLVIDEITLLGSRCGPFAPALAALASGRVDPSPLIDAVLPLREGPEAFARAQRKGALKVLLDMRPRDARV